MKSSGIHKTSGLSAGIGQITDVEYARGIAKRIFDMYDRDKNGVIDNFEATPMLQDTYLNMNRSITPTKYDMDSYHKVLDQNGDGRITLVDLENLIIKYFCGNRESTRFSGHESRYTERTTMAVPRSESVKRSSVLSPEASRRITSSEEDREENRGFVHRQLEQARRIFRKYDTDNSGYIDEMELIPMLEDTYKTLGSERKITKDDVKGYLGMIDVNHDGRISLMEFESIVIKALERVGISFA